MTITKNPMPAGGFSVYMGGTSSRLSQAADESAWAFTCLLGSTWMSVSSGSVGPPQLSPERADSPGRALPFKIPKNMSEHFRALIFQSNSFPSLSSPSFWLVYCCLCRLLSTAQAAGTDTLVFKCSWQMPGGQPCLHWESSELSKVKAGPLKGSRGHRTGQTTNHNSLRKRSIFLPQGAGAYTGDRDHCLRGHCWVGE